MTPERWDQVADLFNAALEQSPEERATLLTGADPDLRREVERLLAAYEDEPDYLEVPVGRLPDDLFPEPELERVGPYRLLRGIGVGGMGTVHLAVRDDDQYRKEVAVKLIKRGMDTDEILRRFRAERQILASLEHPHIGRLLDGGMTEDHRPYLVMEYVDGEPLDVFCDRRRLPVRERLQLFRTVCAAVHHAHQNLIVHRDLKPSNILVTDDGVPKLLDFGIAKLLDPDRTDFTAPVTRTELRLMTPEYASPEQVRGAAITTASDVYQLGVLLYELLTGHRPYRLRERATDEIARVICEEEPERPSTAVGRTEPPAGRADAQALTPEAVSAARGTEPERLQRRLAGDLDTIVLKAMQKEPGRRYASAEALSDDVRRYLTGRPVHARPDTVGYRMRKFVRRNRVGVGLAAAFAVVLAGFGLALALQARTVAEERDVARAERDKAEEVVQVLVDLFETSNPTVVPGGDTLRVGDFLERGETRVLEALEDRPAVQARMKQVLGKVYVARSQFARARPLLEEALARQRELAGPDDPDALSMQHDLALLLNQIGDPEAEAMLRESLERHRRHYGVRSEQAAQALDDLAGAVSDDAERERLLEEALAIRRTVLPPVSVGLAASWNDLAALYLQHGKLDEAASHWRQSLDILEQIFEETHPYVLTVTSNLATAHSRAGRYEEAAALYRQTLDRQRAVIGPESFPVANNLSNLGVALTSLGDYAEAEEAFRDALTIWGAVLPEDHWRRANDLRNLGMVLQQRGATAEGLAYLEEALAVNRRLYGAESPQSGYVTGQIGTLLLHAGDTDGALRRTREALRLLEGAPNDPLSGRADTRIRLGQVLLETGAAEEAERHFREALRYRSDALPPRHPKIAEAACGLGTALADRGAFDEAEELLRPSLPTYAAWGRADALLLARARASLERLPEETVAREPS